MSDDTTADTTEPPEAGDRTEPTTDAATADDTVSDDNEGAGREAAKYRRRLREAEADRDRLAERVAGFQRAEVERLASSALAAPGDLWMAGAELGALVDDDGNVDAGKVTALVEGVVAERPHWRRSQGEVGAGARESVKVGPAPVLTDLIRNR